MMTQLAEAQQHLVCEIEKGDSTCIRVHATRYRGRRYCDIREWWQDEDGTWCPSKKGVNVPEQHLDRLERAINLVREMPAKVE